MMFTFYQRWREKRQAQKAASEQAAKAEWLLIKQKQEACEKTGHSWESSYEIQGDGDPNIEGYVMITTKRCRYCGAVETDIEPYDKNEE
ncbi:hypothetical protein SDC9_94518 [bioreactor metagenome]|uniref:Uncharacterized protein n=1 Tax=bioreactor metagenome TaxID=1076179 RepID=A0A645A3N8_9ZZZZ